MKRKAKKTPDRYVVGYAPPAPNPLVFGSCHFKPNGFDACNRMSLSEARKAVKNLTPGKERAIFKLVRVK